MPIVNGRAISWSNLEFSVMRDGAPAKIIGEFRSVSYDDSTDGVIVPTTGYMPRHRTDGQYVPGGFTSSWLESYLRRFAADLIGNSGLPLSSFDLLLQVNKRFRGSQAVDYDKVYFSMNSLSDDMAPGGDATETEQGGLLMKVERYFDGKLIQL